KPYEQHRGEHREQPEGDGGFPTREDDGVGRHGRRLGCLRAHFAATSFVMMGRCLRGAAPGVGSRKMARTRGGAAMNNTMSDWTTTTMSIVTPSAACIE